ncbi:response regulator [Candidatus Omnitrophota bacterium]
MNPVKTEIKNILIVEDEHDMQEMYKLFFAKMSDRYTVDIESKADTALKRTRKKEYDLIILDIIMEPMSGDAFFMRARDAINTTLTPILVVSVLDPASLKELKKINHVSFLQKPITKEQLFAKLEELLG